MDTEYTVNIGQTAEVQLMELIRYIKDVLQAPGTARDMLDLLETEIYSLSLFPNRYALTEEEPWHGQGVHKMPVRNYLVYYMVTEGTHTVDVIAVIYGSRDQLRQLAQTKVK